MAGLDLVKMVVGVFPCLNPLKGPLRLELGNLSPLALKSLGYICMCVHSALPITGFLCLFLLIYIGR